MSEQFTYNHNLYTLKVHGVDSPLDVLCFHGEEQLSQPFTYCIEFTASDLDITAEAMLKRPASFSLYPAGKPKIPRGFAVPDFNPLRTVHGYITHFKRLSASLDEARYEATLQPRLALLGRGQQFRIYQHQSVPEIVKSILRDRHRFLNNEYNFDRLREYPRREQVMQFGESDLAFIDRLLAEVGIFYRCISSEKYSVGVVEFYDSQFHCQPIIDLPNHPSGGFNSHFQDSVWDLQTAHQVVEKHVNVRAYNPRNIRAYLNGEIDQTRGVPTTYGEAYHYAEPYTVLGDRFEFYKNLPPETGVYFARLRHERYLNDRVRLSGVSSSAGLLPGGVLNVDGKPLTAFAPGAVITHLSTRAGRGSNFEARFQAIPWSADVCFRPPVPPKPKMAGTIPARLTSPTANYPYSEIDFTGRYRVSFMFDRDTWKAGAESMWLRLARPYAGDTYGLHFPLIPGTEVAVAFEQGDPDRPYIAHALHDDQNPDHVTLEHRNYRRNVLRTPANNKLRMEDDRGQEHVKLSTEHSGKSQLNLGHLVDAKKQKRGEGFELRTDGWGTVRGGKGVFISADEQTKAMGNVLAMQPITLGIEGAKQQLAECRVTAEAHHSRPPSIQGLQQFQRDADDLKAPAILLSAPKGIGVLTPASLLLRSGNALYLQSNDEINLAAAHRLSAHANQSISLLAQQEGMRLVSGKGPLEIESHGDLMNLIAQQDITMQSVQGHLQLTAKNGITLGCGGGYIRITAGGEIQIHSPNVICVKGQYKQSPPAEQDFPLPELPGSVCKECLKKAQAEAVGFLLREARA
ncbi:type VI secretion system Vgr family protein [Pseudomonas mandelii]|uniref:type VI secretion system Vgr family protein n=1 Tax=Pseudomonas mandelii TaxID=75612 RepID=UPI00224ABFDB|nr:type VI secretion system Vgr family protein [Pseudomonas mandelii]MCX2900063.1 type VI secretion system tip protein VgrG [Pseudomonas mandelii]